MGETGTARGPAPRSSNVWCAEPDNECGPDVPCAPVIVATDPRSVSTLGRLLPPGTSRRQNGGVTMEVVHARCAGLDVHKQTVVACVRVTLAGRAHHEVRAPPRGRGGRGKDPRHGVAVRPALTASVMWRRWQRTPGRPHPHHRDRSRYSNAAPAADHVDFRGAAYANRRQVLANRSVAVFRPCAVG